MDERTFQQELHQLKQRVENMASRHSPRRLPPQMAEPSHQAPADGFHTRLEDIRQHLTDLDHKLYAISAARVPLMQNPPSTHYSQQSPSQHESAISPQNRMTLPSGPLFWQLFTSLSSDVRSIGARVSGLEQNVSDLEDRVDGLEAPQFTPASSVGTAAETGTGGLDSAYSAQQPSMSAPMVHVCSIVQPNGEVRKARVNDSSSWARHQESHRPEIKGELFRCTYPTHDFDFSPEAPGIALGRPPPRPESLPLHEDKISVSLPDVGSPVHPATPFMPGPTDDEAARASSHDNTKIAESLLRTKLDAAEISVDILRKYNRNMENDVASLDKYNAKLVSNIMKLHSRLSLDHRWNAPRLQESELFGEPVRDPLVGFGAAIGEERARPPLTSFTFARELDCPDDGECHLSMATEVPAPSIAVEAESTRHHLAASRLNQVPVEGVAFRDMEIARMDELLRQANEDSKRSEDRAWTAEQRVAQQDDDIRNLQDAVAQREEDLQHLNEYLRTRGEQRDRLLEHFREASERSQEKTAIICAADQKIDELQRILQACQDSKDEEIDRMMQGRENEFRRLQEFCEQKDVVCRRQEEVIARGVRLMQQKDEEIEQLTRRLKATEDDVDHEGRQRDRVVKLLQERDTEIEELKEKLATRTALEVPEVERLRDTASTPTPELQDGGIQNDKSPADDADSAAHDGASPFASSSHHPGPRRLAHTWSPRPIHGDRRTGEEARRAYVWEHGPDPSRPVFGQPSPLGHRRHHRSAPRSVRYADDAGVVHPAPRNKAIVNGAQQEQPSGKRDGSPMASRNTRPREMEEIRQRPSSGSFAAPGPAPPNQRRQPMADNRRSLPMDRTFWPPLPAPVAAGVANRMQPQSTRSMADMRASVAGAGRKHQTHDDHHERERRGEGDGEDGQGAPRGGAKHFRHAQSMQELKRQRRDLHQAYVETEAESGGEMGGDV